MKKYLPFATALLVPFVGLRAAVVPEGFHLWLMPLVLFVIVPLLDPIVGKHTDELEEEEAGKNRDFRYDAFLWAWLPLQAAAIACSVLVVGELDARAFALLTISVGIVSGLGINVAHELVHRRGRAERAIAEMLMTLTTYTHFCIEHVHGHHKHVATPIDPASSRRGQTLYAFWFRSVFGGVRSAWRIESARVQQQGGAFTLKDRRVRYPLVLLAVYAAVAGAGGAEAVAFFFLQSVVGFTLLEIINYVEHYGLSRRELAPGKFERCLPQHSWNASERLTNLFLFQLQRHADHHHLASRPYFTLRHVEDSPQLPTGYAAMLVLAAVPPLWFRVMNPRVDAWNQAHGAH